MAGNPKMPRLTNDEIQRAFTAPESGARFPPVLTVDQAAELLQVPKATVYDWSSRGLLAGCGRKVGKHLRLWRDKLLFKIFNEGLDPDAERK
jgi:excisionase family DNA binding protein